MPEERDEEFVLYATAEYVPVGESNNKGEKLTGVNGHVASQPDWLELGHDVEK